MVRLSIWKGCLTAAVLAVSVAGMAQAQDQPYPPQFRPLLQKPSKGMIAKFMHWRLRFEKGTVVDAPQEGAFASFSVIDDGTARLFNNAAATSAKLTGVAKRTRYVPAAESHTDSGDKVITKAELDLVRGPEVLKFIAARHLDKSHLDIEKNLAVVLVQTFDAALRTAGKRERIWSVYWRVEKHDDTHYFGYAIWGLFVRANGVMKPIYLAGDSSDPETDPYYYLLALGDLDGDGIDEFIVREKIFEGEDDSLAILAWEKGAPVMVHQMPSPRGPAQ